MPLHQRKEIRHRIDECVFTSAVLEHELPKYRFPTSECIPDAAFQAISDELFLDGNARQNLATFCQTWEEPQVHALMDLAINKNLMDKDEYPQSAEIERRCVHMLADLWNAPGAANTVGASALGSSEACMLAGMAAKWRWRASRKAAGKPFDKPNMVCGPVQVVWHKFAVYWEIEMREVPMAPGRYCMEPEQMIERVDENTILVVPTFGVTYTGRLRGRGRTVGRARPAAGGDEASTSTSMSTGRVAPSWRRSAHPTSTSTSACRGSSRSRPRATSSAWPRSGSVGWSGATSRAARGADLPCELPGW